MRAFVCRDAMEGVGLRQLDGADLAPAFAAAGVLPQTVTARIGVSKLISVNTVRGRWALIDGLATTPLLAPAPVSATPVLATAPQQQVHLAAAAARPKAAALSLEQLEGTVRSVAAEVLGDSELGSNGHFPAGGWARGCCKCVLGASCAMLGSMCLTKASLPLVPQMCVRRWL